MLCWILSRWVNTEVLVVLIFDRLGPEFCLTYQPEYAVT